MAVVKFLLKALFGILVLVFILGVCLLGLGIWSVPKLGAKGIDSWVESRTGFSAIVNSVELKVFSGRLDIEGMALLNPPYYQNKNFMQIRQISVQMQPTSLFRSRKVFDYVYIDVDRITLVRNAQGSINAKEFFRKLAKKSKSYSDSVGDFDLGNIKSKKSNLFNNYIIRSLVIKVGGIDTVGLSSEKDVQNFALNYSKEFTDVTDMESIMEQIVVDFSANGIFSLARDLLSLPLDMVLGDRVSAKVQNIPDKINKGVEKAFRFLQKVVK